MESEVKPVVNSKCAVSPWADQHQLIARQPIEEGEVIIAESPLVTMPTLSYDLGSIAGDLTDRLLSDPKILKAYQSWDLKISDFECDPIVAASLAAKHKCNTKLVARLFASVATNNIAYFDQGRGVIGHGLYRILSRANHSCDPNARLMPGDQSNQETALVALRSIRKGDAITWSYAGEGSGMLDADYSSRNETLLYNFEFICACERCKQEQPSELKNLDPRKLLLHFRKLVAEQLNFG